MSFIDTAKLPYELRTLVESEMQPGERIDWLDQPIPGRLARSTLPILLFGIPWTAFALFWTAGAAWGASKADGGPWMLHVFPLFGLPFILIGLGMLSSPYWVHRRARRTAYVLTDRRAVVFSAGWRGSTTVRSFDPTRLGDLQRKQNADGSGDLIFTQDLWRDSDGDRHTTNVGFLAVRNVKQAEEMVRALVQRGAR
jgi:hypothetical protein